MSSSEATRDFAGPVVDVPEEAIHALGSDLRWSTPATPVAEAQPRLVAARTALGARRRGSPARRRRRAADVDRRGRRGARRSATTAACRSPSRVVAAVCAVPRHRCSAASSSMPTGLAGVVVDRRGLRHRRGAARHVRTRPRRRTPRRSGLSVGHFPQSFDLATVGGWIGSRGAGQYSTRYGKIEDMVVGLEVVLADGTRGPHRRRARGRGGPRSHPAVRRVRGHARRHHQGLAAHPPDSRARTTCGLLVRVVRRRRSRPAGGSCSQGRTPAVLRLYDARRVASAARAATAPSASCSCSTRATPASSTRRCRSSSGPARRRSRTGRRRPRRRVARPPQRHLGAAGAHPQGVRRRHDGDRRLVVDASTTLFDDVRAAMMAVPHARAATCHLSHSYCRRRVSVLHVRRHAPGRRDRVDLHRAVGCRPASGARRRREPVAPPRGGHQPRSLHGRGPRLGPRRADRRSRRRSIRTAS